MAKLSARGRTELYRVAKQLEGTTTIHKRALMSDNVILASYSFLEYDGRHRRSSGWHVHGKLKTGVTPEQWLERRLSEGWTRVTR